MYYHADVLERLLFYGKPFAGALGKNDAFVRGFLQIPRLRELQAKLSCEASLEFNSIQLQSTLLMTQLNSALLKTTLLNSTQLDLKIS